MPISFQLAAIKQMSGINPFTGGTVHQKMESKKLDYRGNLQVCLALSFIADLEVRQGPQFLKI